MPGVYPHVKHAGGVTNVVTGIGGKAMRQGGKAWKALRGTPKPPPLSVPRIPALPAGRLPAATTAPLDFRRVNRVPPLGPSTHPALPPPLPGRLRRMWITRKARSPVKMLKGLARPGNAIGTGLLFGNAMWAGGNLKSMADMARDHDDIAMAGFAEGWGRFRDLPWYERAGAALGPRSMVYDHLLQSDDPSMVRLGEMIRDRDLMMQPDPGIMDRIGKRYDDLREYLSTRNRVTTLADS